MREVIRLLNRPTNPPLVKAAMYARIRNDGLTVTCFSISPIRPRMLTDSANPITTTSKNMSRSNGVCTGSVGFKVTLLKQKSE